MDPVRLSGSKKGGSKASSPKRKGKGHKGKKKKRHHIPRSDLQLLGSRAGIRVLIRRIGSKYGNTRVSGSAIDLVKENGGEYTTNQLLIAIDIAAKSAHLCDRKTVLESDMKLALYALDSISNK